MVCSGEQAFVGRCFGQTVEQSLGARLVSDKKIIFAEIEQVIVASAVKQIEQPLLKDKRFVVAGFAVWRIIVVG